MTDIKRRHLYRHVMRGPNLYGWAVPVDMGADGVRLVDTYRLNLPRRDPDALLASVIDLSKADDADTAEAHRCVVQRAIADYAGTGAWVDAHGMDDMGDLASFRPIRPGESAGDYWHQDVIRSVQLCFEHRYSMSAGRALGCDLVKTDAKPDPGLEFRRLVGDVANGCEGPLVPDYELMKLKNHIKINRRTLDPLTLAWATAVIAYTDELKAAKTRLAPLRDRANGLRDEVMKGDADGR